MEITVLGSGSRGNSILVTGKEDAILVDAGFSAREIARRLSACGYDLKDIGGLFITHEHSDHIRGAQVLGKRGIPVHLNKPTFDANRQDIPGRVFFEPSQGLFEGCMEITPVATSHDAAMPCGFLIKEKKAAAGVFTDLGTVTSGIRSVISRLDCLVLEANHDVDMLVSGPYPYYLKQRILSDTGHLSNIDAGICVRDSASERLRTVFLAHLSEINNTPDKAEGTFSMLAGSDRMQKIEKIVTRQDAPSITKKV